MVLRNYLFLTLLCISLAGCGGSSEETASGAAAYTTATSSSSEPPASTEQVSSFETTSSTQEPSESHTCRVVNIVLNTPEDSILSKTANDIFSITVDLEFSASVYEISIETGIYDNKNDHFRYRKSLGDLQSGRHIQTLQMEIRDAPIEYYRKFLLFVEGARSPGEFNYGGTVWGCNASADVSYFVVE